MKEKLNIEQLFKTKLEGAEIEPSGQVWKKTMRSYRRKQFLKFRPGRFNVFYAAGIVIAGMVLIIPRVANNGEEIQQSNIEIDSIREHSPVNSDNIQTGELSTESDNTNNNTNSKAGDTGKISQSDDTENHTAITDSGNSIAYVQPEEDLTPSNPSTVESLIAYFTPSQVEGCAPISIAFLNGSINGNTYNWRIGSLSESYEGRDLNYTFREAGTYIVTLTVSNTEGISQSYSEEITVHPAPKAEFQIENEILYNNSINASEFVWSYSDREGKSISNDFQPNLKDFVTSGSESSERQLVLVAKNNFGCTDTAMALIPMNETKHLEFPSAFLLNINGPTGGYYNITSPDNTIFHPVYEEIPSSYELSIYNKAGELIFISRDIQIGWDGYHKEAVSAKGVYVYVCNGTWSDGQSFHYRGDVTVL